MTRRHTTIQLLRLGALSLGEFVTITGWPYKTARQTLSSMVESGLIDRHSGVYEVAS